MPSQVEVIIPTPGSRSNGALDGNGDDGRLHVAIVGGGITGLTLALALSARGVRYTVYERSAGPREIGAGVGLSANAERALHAANPRAHAAFKRVAAPNGEDAFQWVDGTADSLIYALPIGGDDGLADFQGCRRSDLLEELARLLKPEGGLRFGKTVDAVEDDESSDKVLLRFKDGTVAEADVVIGCDGIHSRMRQLLLGEDNPASYATYTGKFCFRTIVPMAQAAARPDIAHRIHTRFMFNGPGAHVITYPIGASADILNVLLVISDPSSPEQQAEEDTRKRPTVARGSKREAVAAFATFHPTVRGMVDLLPDDDADGAGQVLRWDIYDMLERPAPYYSRGRACVAGDAAHASSPHLGSGAGFGIEDALALAAVLEAVDGETRSRGNDADGDGSRTTTAAAAAASNKGDRRKADLVRAALQAYDEIRLGRTQWLPGASRDACALFQWGGEAGRRARDDHRWYGEEITRLFRQIWDYDLDGMVRDVVAGFRARAGIGAGTGAESAAAAR